MGVHGLWELLAPVGRRVSVETLAGKKLAIDASIWMIQFMKAMRDEKGEMVRNAHILGFFRRICKLLFLRTKPVFVFDGGTPALKGRTVIARRRQRENAQAKVRKTAEKLLLNHLKAMKLKELAEEIKNQRPKNKDKKGGEGLSDHNDKAATSNLDKNDVASSQEKLDAMLAASIAAEEGASSNNNPSPSATVVLLEGEDGDEEMIIPALHGKIDPAVFAALPQSMQDALAQIGDVEIKEPAKNLENHGDDKGKKVLLEHTDFLGSDNSRKDNMVSKIYNQEKLDEMLAASIAVEDHNSTNNVMTSAAGIYSEDYFNEDEEIILPSMHGKVDTAVLAALPPSMQLDLFGQMRERLMAENRQKYQKVKKAPEKFSELQIESYLKTVAFRRQIDQVQKSAAGRGIDGVQTSRIASEANREYIFSSSFTGDKQVIASSGMKKRMDERHTAMEPRKTSPNNVASTSKSDMMTVPVQEKTEEVGLPVGAEKSGVEQYAEMGNPSTYLDKSGASTSNSDTMPESAPDKSKRKFDDVETYLDERGHLRVSRVRAMGIRMTRDLQRNLDLMKEVEHESNTNKNANAESIPGGNENNIPKSLPGKHQFVETSTEGNDESLILNKRNEQSMFKGEASIEICFKGNDETECFDDDDELFARLVAEDPISISSAEKMSLRKQSSESASDSDWEEGHIERKSNCSTQDDKEIKPFLKEGNGSDDSEVEWEEDDCVVTKSISPSYHEPGKPVSRGSLEEVADLEEAIRRSLHDLKDKKPIDALSGSTILDDSVKEVCGSVGFPCKDNLFQPCILGTSTVTQTESFCDHVDRSENSTGVDGMNVSRSIDSLTLNTDKLEKMMTEQCQTAFCQSETLKEASGSTNMYNKERQCPEKLLEASNQNSELSTLPNRYLGDAHHIPYTASGGMPHVTRVEGQRNDVEAELSHLGKPINPAAPPVYTSTKVIDTGQTMIGGTNDDYFKKMEPSEEVYSVDGPKVQFGVTEDTLEEEMLILAQERISLGDEQRRLERNAESVSSEMFAECQELLQMFGLPYIIAPMEAEAQCAYMELANLVDGVVTDDSDVFLFGARSVYKNIFDDRKYVETYFMKDIENELGLTRQKLMRIALLLGSDYTEGISGIGIVNAIEVVNAFPEENGLHKFREWVESPDPTILGKFGSRTGSRSRKKGLKVSEKGLDQNGSEAHELELPPTPTYIEDEKKIFMDKHRNVSKNWYIPSSFPSEAVISAYASPQVDKSTEPFSWGKPDQAVLRKLKFGWGSQKADDLLLPVLKEYNKHETQLRLEAFYTFNERFAKIRSKRIKKAIKGITGNQLSELTDDAKQEDSNSRKKGRVSAQKCSEKEAEKPPKEKKESLATSQSQQSRKRKIGSNPSEMENPKAPLLAERKQSTRTKPKGGDGGRGRGRGAVRGMRKESPDFELAETSSSDVNSGYEQEMRHHKFEGPQQVRKSGRSQKQVSYILDDTDNEDTAKLSDYMNKNGSSKEVGRRGSTSAEGGCVDVEEGACVDIAAGSDAKELHGVIDHSIEEESCRDYLEIGGGFCMAEGEDGGPVISPVKGELSNDYRKVGGGFCIDEDEERDATYIPDTMTSEENVDLIHNSGNVNQDGGRPNKMDTEQTTNHHTASSKENSKVNVLLQENAKDDTSAISVGVLKAMPSLRRKRRKG